MSVDTVQNKTFFGKARWRHVKNEFVYWLCV